MANKKFCHCEPGYFPDTHFYTDPYHTEIHLTGPGIRGHFTSTCDEYAATQAPPDSDPGAGPGVTGMILKYVLGPVVAGEKGPGTLVLSDLNSADILLLADSMGEQGIEEIVQSLYRTDLILSTPNPFPKPVVSLLGDAILGKEKRRLSLFARMGGDLRKEIDRRLIVTGFLLSSTNFDQLIDFISGDIDGFKR